MDPFTLCLLVAFFVVRRYGADFTTGAARVAAKAADKVAGAAGRRGKVGRWLAGKATAAAGRLRSRPAPTQPRTRAGQQFGDRVASATGRGLGTAAGWVRLAWTDAKAAARNVQARAAAGERRQWWRWPFGDDPQAPISAVAERLDRDADDQVPAADTTAPTSTDEPAEPAAPTPPTADEDQVPAEDVVHPCPLTDADGRHIRGPGDGPRCLYCGELFDQAADTTAPTSTDEPAGPVSATAERLDQDQPAQHQLPAARLAITDGKEHNQMDTVVAEGGLDAYIGFGEHYVNTCNDAVNDLDTSIAATENNGSKCVDAANAIDLTQGSLTSQDWSGAPIDALSSAKEHMAAAASDYATCTAALASAKEHMAAAAGEFASYTGAMRDALSVREQYNANTHAGTKESVLS